MKRYKTKFVGISPLNEWAIMALILVTFAVIMIRAGVQFAHAEGEWSVLDAVMQVIAR